MKALRQLAWSMLAYCGDGDGDGKGNDIHYPLS
jgi:hypothetical protein